MPRVPVWFNQLTWSVPLPVDTLRTRILASEKPIPPRPGCYVFTGEPGKMIPGQVLYVGKALDLRTRVRGYLVDYMNTAATKHKGRAFLFEYRHHHGDARLFVRWAIYGDPARLEGALIDHLQPQFNDRYEDVELGDDERLDDALLP